jgi:hypothetical protein
MNLFPGYILEGTFWQIITLTVHDSLERANGVLEVNEHTFNTSEHFWELVIAL